MLMRTPVSVIIPVKNEAENLKRCLPALAWADEVFVVDSQSTDATAEVAAEFGAEVVQFHFNGTYPKKKNWALDHLPFRNEWVLIVDADEVVVPELASEIADRIARDEADGFYLNSRYYFLGRHIRHCGYSSCWNLRLFKHRLGRYEKIPDGTGGRAGDNEAHEHVELEGRVVRLANELEHHAYPTVAIWVEKHNRYAIWEAALADRVIEGTDTPDHRRRPAVQTSPQENRLAAAHAPACSFLYAYVRAPWISGRQARPLLLRSSGLLRLPGDGQPLRDANHRIAEPSPLPGQLKIAAASRNPNWPARAAEDRSNAIRLRVGEYRRGTDCPAGSHAHNGRRPPGQADAFALVEVDVLA